MSCKDFLASLDLERDRSLLHCYKIMFFFLLISLYFFAGRPPPKVQWLIDDMVVESKVTQLPGDIVKSSLLLPNLTRQHLHSVLECQASNSNTTLPLSTVVTLDMNCKFFFFFFFFFFFLRDFIFKKTLSEKPQHLKQEQ